MYLIDTNVISEIRKNKKANPGVQRFFQQIIRTGDLAYLSVVTLGELRRGVDLIFHRGDRDQGQVLENWLNALMIQYQDHVLGIDGEIAMLWGKLRVPDSNHALDKLIAATAIIYDLTVVTRNVDDFRNTGARLVNPFTEEKL